MTKLTNENPLMETPAKTNLISSGVSLLQKFGQSQVLGILAQILNAIPAIAIPIYLAWFVSLESVADFAIIMGFASIFFTVALLGLRHRLVLDRFEVYGFDKYVTLRFIALIGLCTGLLLLGFVLKTPITLVLAIILMRCGDMIMDLILAQDQVRQEGAKQLQQYIFGNFCKVLLICLCLAISHFTEGQTAFLAFAVAMGLYFLLTLAFLFRIRKAYTYAHPKLSGLFMLFKVSIVFTIASVICATLTGLPRIALKAVNSAEMAGAEGAALSMATLFGMAYYAIWLQWAPKLRQGSLTPAMVFRFVGENLFLMFGGILGAVFLGAWAMSIIYNIQQELYGDVVTKTLVWSAVFFAVMNFANLFKPSIQPWFETMTYVCGFGTAMTVFYFFAGDIHAWQIMALAVPGMAFALLVGMLYLNRSRTQIL